MLAHGRGQLAHEEMIYGTKDGIDTFVMRMIDWEDYVDALL